MKVEIQDAGPCQKKIKVIIPEESVSKKLDEEFIEMSTMVNIPGFRKGRVPRKILEKRYGPHVEDKVKTDLIEESLREIIDENNINLVGEPKIEELTFERNKPFTFETILEVQPEFELPEYKGLELKKEAKKVEEKDIENTLKEVFNNTNKKLVALEEGEVEEKDIVIAKLEISVDGNPLLSKEEAYIYIGEDNIGNIKVEGLKDKLLGKKNEEVVEFEQELPSDYPEEDHRGKKGSFKITVEDIKRAKYKEPNEEWAKENDYENLQEVKDYLAKELEKTFSERAEQALRKEALDALLKDLDFDLPPGMVEKSLSEHVHYESVMLQFQGKTPEEIETLVEESTPKWKEQVQREIRIFFILDKISKKEKIYVTENDMEEKMLEMAQRHNRNVEDLKEEFSETGHLSRLRWQLREKKALDFLLEKAKITEAE